jgi:hypothetical protein
MERKNIRKLLAIGVLFLFLGAGATLAAARGPWSDNFDSYTNGQMLDGTPDDGGWKGWGGDPAAGGMVTDAQARSAPYSDQVWSVTDNVHEYSESSGQWVYTAWQYLPEDMTGITYFILLSAYDDAGASNVWTVQVAFDAENDLVTSEFDYNTLPLFKGEWKEIRCEIDLDSDYLAIFYADMLLVEKTWSETVQGGGSGPMTIAAVDLWSNGCSPVYYDDLSLLPVGGEFTCGAGGPYTGEVGEDIHFTGFASGGVEPYTWAWDFGDGTTADVQNPTHAYTEAGVYDVTLTVTDDAANIATDTTTATITEVVQEPVLEIGAITGGFGIKSSIKNTGEGDATNVAWTITLDGKLIFVGKTTSDTIATLAPAGDEAIKAGFILGIGKTNIVISATCDEGVSAEATASAFVLGPFVLGVK